jgi:ferric-dicitrate binding protein FerR (iron transport regulator)
MTAEARERLLMRYLRGEATAEEVEQVDELARRDAAFARDLASHAALDACLRETLAVDRQVRRLRPRRPLAASLAWTAAAAACVAALGYLALREEPKPAPQSQQQRPPQQPARVAVQPKPAVETPPVPAPEAPLPPELPKPEPEPESEPEPEPRPEPEPQPESEPPPPPAQPAPPPAPKPTERTVAFAVVERAQGSEPVAEGFSLQGPARIRFPDGSTVDAAPNARIARVVAHGPKGAGKRVELERGDLSMEIVRQPYRHPLIVATPHAEITVLGTTLRVQATKEATRVDVERGRARVTRTSDARSVELRAGMLATAQEGHPFEAAREVPRVVEDHEVGCKWIFGDWSARPLFGVSIEGGRRTFKIVYQPAEDDPKPYTQFRLPAKLAETDRAVRFQIRAVDFAPEADYRVELREADGDVWMVGGARLRTLREGWNVVELPLPLQPANSWAGGDKKFDPAAVVEMYFALSGGPATVYLDDWTLVSVVPVSK